MLHEHLGVPPPFDGDSEGVLHESAGEIRRPASRVKAVSVHLQLREILWEHNATIRKLRRDSNVPPVAGVLGGRVV